MKKYSCKDDFEMLYLRHDYLEKVKNPEEVDLKKFAAIANCTGKKMYEKYKPNFEKVGFEEEDVLSISNVYLLSYMGIYSLRKDKSAMDRFKANFIEKTGNPPTEKQIDRKDRNNLINFLSQKFYVCNIFCKRKARNILGEKDVNVRFAYTKDSVPADIQEIMKDHKKYGYRKITHGEMKEIKKRCRGKRDLFDKSGFGVIEFEQFSKGHLSINYIYDEGNDKTEFSEFIPNSACGKVFGENRGRYHNDVESSYINLENDHERNENKKIFYGLEVDKQIKKLKFFIRENKHDKRLKEQVVLARKFIKSLKNTGKIDENLKKYGKWIIK